MYNDIFPYLVFFSPEPLVYVKTMVITIYFLVLFVSPEPLLYVTDHGV